MTAGPTLRGMRRLALNREILADLSADELAAVAGADAGVITTPIRSCLIQCVTVTCVSCAATSCC